MRYRLDTPMGTFAVRDSSLGWRLRCALEGLLGPGQVVRCSRQAVDAGGAADGAGEAGGPLKPLMPPA